MMSGVPLETCWAFNKLWNNKFYYGAASCWYFYWIIHDARIHEYQILVGSYGVRLHEFCPNSLFVSLLLGLVWDTPTVGRSMIDWVRHSVWKLWFCIGNIRLICDSGHYPPSLVFSKHNAERSWTSACDETRMWYPSEWQSRMLMGTYISVIRWKMP